MSLHNASKHTNNENDQIITRRT